MVKVEVDREKFLEAVKAASLISHSMKSGFVKSSPLLKLSVKEGFIDIKAMSNVAGMHFKFVCSADGNFEGNFDSDLLLAYLNSLDDKTLFFEYDDISLKIRGQDKKKRLCKITSASNIVGLFEKEAFDRSPSARNYLFEKELLKKILDNTIKFSAGGSLSIPAQFSNIGVQVGKVYASNRSIAVRSTKSLLEDVDLNIPDFVGGFLDFYSGKVSFIIDKVAKTMVFVNDDHYHGNSSYKRIEVFFSIHDFPFDLLTRTFEELQSKGVTFSTDLKGLTDIVSIANSLFFGDNERPLLLTNSDDSNLLRVCMEGGDKRISFEDFVSFEGAFPWDFLKLNCQYFLETLKFLGGQGCTKVDLSVGEVVKTAMKISDSEKKVDYELLVALMV